MTDSCETEGVVKYRLTFDQADLMIAVDLLTSINTCRDRLRLEGLIGQDDKRYGGLGFGNLSVRYGSNFLITGTQTGHLPRLNAGDLAEVTEHDTDENYLAARGQTPPSSEAMTHAVLYTLTDAQGQFSPGAVIHAHAPNIWYASEKLGLPATAADIPYGTPAMARAVKSLGTLLLSTGKPVVFAMKGHQDGIVAAGRHLAGCTETLLDLQQRAQDI